MSLNDKMMDIGKKDLIKLYEKSSNEAKEMRRVLKSLSLYIEKSGQLLINRNDPIHQEMQKVSSVELTLDETYTLERIVMGEDRGHMNSMGLGRLLAEDLIELDMFGERLVVSKNGMDYIKSIELEAEAKNNTKATTQQTEDKVESDSKTSFEKKIEYLNDKNGINSFGASTDDLCIFTVPELEMLCDDGLIADESLKGALMNLCDDMRTAHECATESKVENDDDMSSNFACPQK